MAADRLRICASGSPGKVAASNSTIWIALASRSTAILARSMLLQTSPTLNTTIRPKIIPNTEMNKLKRGDASSLALRALMTEMEAILKTLPAMIRANGVDALLIDPGRFYAELGAIQLGMPYVHVSNALHLDYTGYTPLSLYGWPHLTTLKLWPETGKASLIL
jgi:hypothetical protein